VANVRVAAGAGLECDLERENGSVVLLGEFHDDIVSLETALAGGDGLERGEERVRRKQERDLVVRVRLDAVVREQARNLDLRPDLDPAPATAAAAAAAGVGSAAEVVPADDVQRVLCEAQDAALLQRRDGLDEACRGIRDPLGSGEAKRGR
jgi:hypothetical protein